eukprot:6211456-Pleurochrysis_carterae.AAC.2
MLHAWHSSVKHGALHSSAGHWSMTRSRASCSSARFRIETMPPAQQRFKSLALAAKEVDAASALHRDL